MSLSVKERDLRTGKWKNSFGVAPGARCHWLRDADDNLYYFRCDRDNKTSNVQLLRTSDRSTTEVLKILARGDVFHFQLKPYGAKMIREYKAEHT